MEESVTTEREIQELVDRETAAWDLQQRNSSLSSTLIWCGRGLLMRKLMTLLCGCFHRGATTASDGKQPGKSCSGLMSLFITSVRRFGSPFQIKEMVLLQLWMLIPSGAEGAT